MYEFSKIIEEDRFLSGGTTHNWNDLEKAISKRY